MSQAPGLFDVNNPAAPAQPALNAITANLNAAADRQNQAAMSGAQIQAQADAQKAQIDAAATAQAAELASREALEESRQEGFQNLNAARLDQQREGQAFQAEQAELARAENERIRQEDITRVQEEQSFLLDQRDKDRQRAALYRADELELAAEQHREVQAIAQKRSEEIALRSTAEASLASLEQKRGGSIAKMYEAASTMEGLYTKQLDDFGLMTEKAITSTLTDFEFEDAKAPIWARVAASAADRLSGADGKVKEGIAEGIQRRGIQEGTEAFLGSMLDSLQEEGALAAMGFQNTETAKGKILDLTSTMARRAALDFEDSLPAERAALDQEIKKQADAIKAEEGVNPSAVGILLDRVFDSAELKGKRREQFVRAKVIDSNGKFKDDDRGRAVQFIFKSLGEASTYLPTAGFEAPEKQAASIRKSVERFAKYLMETDPAAFRSYRNQVISQAGEYGLDLQAVRGVIDPLFLEAVPDLDEAVRLERELERRSGSIRLLEVEEAGVLADAAEAGAGLLRLRAEQ